MTKLSKQIKNQIPKHIRNNHELFDLFMEAYYEWLEQTENTYGFLRDFKENFSLDKSMDVFVRSFKREFLESLPDKTKIDKKRLIQHIKNYYLSRGTENSFKFLFKILFDESVSLYYPKNNILKTSDGTWIANERVLYLTTFNDMGDITLRELSQEWLDGSELKTGKGTIKDIKIINNEYYSVARVVLTDVVGEFTEDEPVTIAGIFQEYIYPIVDTINITSAGTGYVEQEEINIVAGSYYEIEKSIPASLVVNLGVTSFLDENDLVVTVNSVPQTAGVDYTFDGSNLSLPNAIEGQVANVMLPSYEGDIVINSVGSGGEIEEILIKEFPIGFSTIPSYTINTSGGSGASLLISYDNNVFIPGRYKDTRGHLSSNMYLQDSDYYQEYSYVIRTGISLDTYADAVKKAIHPAGMKFFGEIYSVEDLRMELAAFEDELKVQLPAFVSIYDGIEDVIKNLVVGPPQGSRDIHLDTFKRTHTDFSTNINFFGNKTIDEINGSNLERNNIAAELDFKLTYLGSTLEQIDQAAFDIYRVSDWVNDYRTYTQVEADNFILSY